LDRARGKGKKGLVEGFLELRLRLGQETGSHGVSFGMSELFLAALCEAELAMKAKSAFMSQKGNETME
jgi:hypothetical protein